MSVTYIYSVDSAGDLTSAGTSSTSGNTLNSNELLWVTSGSSVTGAVLQTSAVSLTGSGTAVTNPGGSTWVYNGGSITANGPHVTSTLTGGAAVIDNGATLVSATVDSGAGVLVLSGGVTSGSILNGGFEVVTSGGSATGTITSGGTESLYAGASATSTSVASGGQQEIYSGGVATAAQLGGFGTQDVWSGGTANSATLNNGATQNVHSGGGSFASDNVAGHAVINGFDLSGTVIDTGVMDVMSGGTAQSTFVTSGGIQNVDAGGIAKGVNLEILGTQIVMSGGTANNTYLTGGVMKVQNGGIATAPLLSAGEILVSAGGVVSGGTALAGTIEVLSGGTAYATILSGGQQIVMGGTASGTHIMSGGSEVVVSGSSIAPIVYGGGSEIIYSGATVQNVQISGAGTLSLVSGAIVSGDVVFGAAGGRLQLVGTTLPSVKIDNFEVGDSIDFNNLTGNTASYKNGVLTLAQLPSGGGIQPQTAQIVATLSLSSEPDGALSVASDGHGGTLITVVPYSAAGAIAAYANGGLTGGTLISDSAANVLANLDGLENLVAGPTVKPVVSITLTDSGTPNLAVTATQLSADAGALNVIAGNFTVTADATAAASGSKVSAVAGHGMTVNLASTSSDWQVTSKTATGTDFILTQGSTGHTVELVNATALHFSDATEIVATAYIPVGTSLSSLNVAELYSAALNRAPDVAGLAFYENAIKANPALSGVALGEYFLSSSEYTSAHNYAQSSAGDTQFVSDLYTNILHRAGSSSEIAFYQNVINGYLSGQTAGTAGYSAAELQAHAQVLQYFSASAEFLSDIQITAQHAASASHWLLLI